MNPIALVEKDIVAKKVPAFSSGDHLKVHLRVKEGDKTRIQVFEGTCIARRGTGAGASFSVVKESHGDVVTKIFPLYSPTIEKIVVTKTKKRSRRAKLYYLSGKK
jgi:large subunit ribosomal protein L19